MNKVLILIFFVVAGFSSCQKESDKPLFSQSPDDRLSETLAAYQTQLSGAENGWKALITTDTIKLVGRFHGSKATLIRATKEEGDAYLGGQFVLFSNYLDKIFTYFKRFTIEGQSYDIKADPLHRTIIFSWLDGSGNTQSFS